MKAGMRQKGRGHLEVMLEKALKTRNQHVKKSGSKTRPVIRPWRLRQDCVRSSRDKSLDIRLLPGPRIKAWKVGWGSPACQPC